MPAFSKTSRLFLCPDGELYCLPFEALPTKSGAHLLDDYEISYLAAGRDVLRFAADARPRSVAAAPLVVADPDYGLKRESAPEPAPMVEGPADVSARAHHALRDGGRKFRQLEGARREGVDVAQLLQVSPVLGGEAREGRIKEYRSPRILHIATHGFFLENARSDERANPLDTAAPWDDLHKTSHRLRDYANPMLRSGLALAGINTWLDGELLPLDAEDGVLTAVDVSGLDLGGTEIVVLSACETGLGDARFGDGVVGLRRAFVVAGARSLIMSLWKVPDRETRILMVDFYQRLLAGTPREQALREAQRALKEKYPEPLYWGAFILQGAPGPIAADS